MTQRPAAGVRAPLTRIPFYLGPLPQVQSDCAPWPGETLRLGGVALHARRPPGMALDLPGFGRSAPPPGFDYAPGSQAAVIAAFLTGLRRGPVHLVGNSMGGAVALLLAARYPHLVRTLTLLAPAMPDLRVNLRRMSDPRIALALLPVIGTRMRRALAATSAEEHTERIMRLCFADPSRVSAVRRAGAVQERAEWAALKWATAAMARSTERLVRAWLVLGPRSLWRVAAVVRAPALVVWGAADNVVSVRKAPRTAAALPRGRLFVLPRTGHVPQIERPNSVARAVLGLVDAVNHYRW